MNDDNSPVTRGDLKRAFIDHEAVEKANGEAQLATFMAAFPDGDPVPHRAYHEAKIKAAQAEERFWAMAQEKVVEKGIEGIFWALKIVVILALTGAAMKFGLTLPMFGGK